MSIITLQMFTGLCDSHGAFFDTSLLRAAWQQHDIQELCRVMFDALEQKWKQTVQVRESEQDAHMKIFSHLALLPSPSVSSSFLSCVLTLFQKICDCRKPKIEINFTSASHLDLQTHPLIGNVFEQCWFQQEALLFYYRERKRCADNCCAVACKHRL